MALQPQAVYVVPEDTARVARAASPQGNAHLRMHDELGRLYADRDFATLFPVLGQPARAPAQRSLGALMQFAEYVTDRQAAEAVRARIGWKYALCLELEDPGFDHSVLCAFRARLLAAGQEALLFEQLLARCREAGLVRARRAAMAVSSAEVLVLRAARARASISSGSTSSSPRSSASREGTRRPVGLASIWWTPRYWSDDSRKGVHDGKTPSPLPADVSRRGGRVGAD